MERAIIFNKEFINALESFGTTFTGLTITEDGNNFALQGLKSRYSVILSRYMSALSTSQEKLRN